MILEFIRYYKSQKHEDLNFVYKEEIRYAQAGTEGYAEDDYRAFEIEGEEGKWVHIESINVLAPNPDFNKNLLTQGIKEGYVLVSEADYEAFKESQEAKAEQLNQDYLDKVQARAIQKQAVLDKLNLTEEEGRALLG